MKCNKLLTLIVIFLCVCSFLNCQNKKTELLKFSVMGDVPRSEKEKVTLQEQIANHNSKSAAEFMVHVGDIKSGKDSCNEVVYAEVAGFLKKLTVPTFMVPGDNEWNDCKCPPPDTAWIYWEKYFLNFENNWSPDFDCEHQENQPENFAFIWENVVFIGINLVGGKVHDAELWAEKMLNDVNWIRTKLNSEKLLSAVIFAQANPDEKHKLFMDEFLDIVSRFEKPVLFIHGDGHKWIYDNPWLRENLIRVQIDKGGIADPLEVTIAKNKKLEFIFDRNPF